MTATDTHRAIDAVWRIESARLIAGLARMVRDVGLAEDLAQDALVAALEQWPESGVPRQPGRLAHGHRQAPRDRPPAPEASCSNASTRSSAASSRPAGAGGGRRDLDAALDDDVGDDLLRLMFTACHPVLSTEARVALTLRLLGGLTHRGDRARVPRPGADRRPAHRPGQADPRRSPASPSRSRAAPSSPPACRRCSRSSTSSSTRATRRPPATTGCGPRSARTRSASAASWPSSRPDEPEVHGLVALMEIQASRSARAGRPVGGADPAPRSGPRALGPPPDPSRARRARAGRGARGRARPVRPAGRDRRLSRAGAHRGGDRLGAHRRALRRARPRLTPSPVVELNRAVAVAMAFGPAAGLELVDALTAEPALQGLPPPAERARRPPRQARPPRRGSRRSSSARPPSPATPASAASCSSAPPRAPGRCNRRSRPRGARARCKSARVTICAGYPMNG